jgi:hypothetical protein
MGVIKERNGQLCTLLSYSTLPDLPQICREIPQDASRIPNVTYAVLKDRQLKSLLSEQGIPVTGDRTAWITRYERYFLELNLIIRRSIQVSQLDG